MIIQQGHAGSRSAPLIPKDRSDGSKARRRTYSVPVPWTANSVTITLSLVSARSREEIFPNSVADLAAGKPRVMKAIRTRPDAGKETQVKG